jgi:hypothetical protein
MGVRDFAGCRRSDVGGEIQRAGFFIRRAGSTSRQEGEDAKKDGIQ